VLDQLHELEEQKQQLITAVESIAVDQVNATSSNLFTIAVIKLITLRKLQSEYTELKRSIQELQYELLQEQLKVKTLSEEMHKNINIHRWRQLMDTDTATYCKSI